MPKADRLGLASTPCSVQSCFNKLEVAAVIEASGEGRYEVRLEDKRRKKLANLRPENCRADVLAL